MRRTRRTGGQGREAAIRLTEQGREAATRYPGAYQVRGVLRVQLRGRMRSLGPLDRVLRRSQRSSRPLVAYRCWTGMRTWGWTLARAHGKDRHRSACPRSDFLCQLSRGVAIPLLRKRKKVHGSNRHQYGCLRSRRSLVAQPWARPYRRGRRVLRTRSGDMTRLPARRR